MERLGKAFDTLMNILAGLAALLLVFMTLSITYAIFVRAIGLQAPVWVVQFNEYSLLWITFLGGAWLLRRRKHVAIDSFTRVLGPKGKSLMGILHCLLGLTVCGLIAWYGGRETWSHLQRGVTDVQAVDVPKYLVIMIIPCGFLLLVLQFGRDLIGHLGFWASKKEAALEPSEPETPDCKGG